MQSLRFVLGSRDIRYLCTTLSANIILSKKNQKRCVDCMRREVPMGIQMEKHPSELTFAAVLILLCRTQGDDVSILYTRRSGQLSRHMRQISFPGGIRDGTDKDFIDCALRETEEEIGLSRTRVHIWGRGVLITPPRTAAIMPVIGSVNNLKISDLHLNVREVEEVFTIPLSKIVCSNALRHTQFKSGYTSPTFIVGAYKIWGVTGYLTNRFLNCLLPKELQELKKHIKFVKPYRYHS